MEEPTIGQRLSNLEAAVEEIDGNQHFHNENDDAGITHKGIDREIRFFVGCYCRDV